MDSIPTNTVNYSSYWITVTKFKAFAIQNVGWVIRTVYRKRFVFNVESSRTQAPLINIAQCISSYYRYRYISKVANLDSVLLLSTHPALCVDIEHIPNREAMLFICFTTIPPRHVTYLTLCESKTHRYASVLYCYSASESWYNVNANKQTKDCPYYYSIGYVLDVCG